MMRFERHTLSIVVLTAAAVCVPFSILSAISEDWGLAVAVLVVVPFFGLVGWLSLLGRRWNTARLVRRGSPIVTSLPEYNELVERQVVPAGWTPSGAPPKAPLKLIFAAGVLFPWFWGPVFGATLGDVTVGLAVAAMLSGTALVVGMLAFAANRYAGTKQD